MNRFVMKYKNMSAPVKASLWFMLSNILMKGISFLTTPIFTRLLSTEQYGAYSLYQSWYSLLIIFATLNLFMGCYPKGLLKFEEDTDKFTSSLLGLCTVSTSIVYGVLILGYHWIGSVIGLDIKYIVVMYIETIFMAAFDFWGYRERFFYRYRMIVSASILMSILNTIIGVIAVLSTTNYKTEAMIYSNVASKLLIAVCVYAYLMLKGKCFVHTDFWKYGIQFNLPLIPHFLSNMVLNQSDRLMIGNMVGKGEAAIYSIGYTIAMMMQLITNAINQTLTPFVYRELKAKRYERIRKIGTSLSLLVLSLCVVAMVVSPELVLFVGGEKYVGAVSVVIPVAASVFFIYLYSLFSTIEYYYEKTSYISTATLVAAGLNLLLNFIFIKLFGYVAAGYTTVFCYMVLAVLHYFFYKKILQSETNMSGIYDIRALILMSIGLFLMMIIMQIIHDSRVLRYSVFAIIIFAALWKRKMITQLISDLKR